MKKIGIITLCGNNNYGNKLQNYALQEVLKEKGYEVDSLWNSDSEKESIKRKIRKFIQYFKKSIEFKINYFKKQNRREKKFQDFSKKYIKYSSSYFSKNKIDKAINKKYDYYIVGSDQVWNYNDPTFSSRYFLDFSDNKKKNISYAASFGLDKIEMNQEFYKKNINNFSFISVREKSAKRNLEKMGINNIEIVLDPTFLLNSDEWQKKFNLQSILDRKYVFCYFLKDNREAKDKIKRYCEKKGLYYVDVFDYKKDYFISGPIEFLSFIKNAEMIFTDSFHATVFSIIFHKKPVVFDKKSTNNNITNSRINDLLDTFELKDRKYDIKKELDFYEKLPNINVDEKIKHLNNISLDFLSQALHK